MAMQKQLWSLSGLAVELGKDRRTIAKALDGVPPDGTVRGTKTWYMQTAMRSLGAGDCQLGINGNTGILDVLRHRAASWRLIHAKPPMAVRIADVAGLMGVPVPTVLVWLRSGLPYLKAGSWETGAGFELHLGWTTEWLAMISDVAERTGDQTARRELQLA